MNSETIIAISSILSGPAVLALFKGISWLVQKKSSRTDEDRVNTRFDREKYIEELRSDIKAEREEASKYRAEMDAKFKRLEEKYEAREVAHQEQIKIKDQKIRELEDRIDLLEEELYKAKMSIEVKEEARNQIHKSVDENLNNIIT